MEQYMHAWEQQREVQQRWTGDFFNAKLVAGVSGSERPHRVQEERRTRLPPPVSYTHLDVYKRQSDDCVFREDHDSDVC